MRRQVRKWVLRIPKPLVADMGLEKDREVELSVGKACLIPEALQVPPYTLEDLLAGIRSTNRHGETDWGPPIGKEIW